MNSCKSSGGDSGFNKKSENHIVYCFLHGSMLFELDHSLKW